MRARGTQTLTRVCVCCFIDFVQARCTSVHASTYGTLYFENSNLMYFKLTLFFIDCHSFPVRFLYKTTQYCGHPHFIVQTTTVRQVTCFGMISTTGRPSSLFSTGRPAVAHVTASPTSSVFSAFCDKRNCVVFSMSVRTKCVCSSTVRSVMSFRSVGISTPEFRGAGDVMRIERVRAVTKDHETRYGRTALLTHAALYGSSATERQHRPRLMWGTARA